MAETQQQQPKCELQCEQDSAQIPQTQIQPIQQVEQAQLQSPTPQCQPAVPLTFEELNAKRVPQLRQICKENKIPNYYKKTKSELIKYILQYYDNLSTFSGKKCSYRDTGIYDETNFSSNTQCTSDQCKSSTNKSNKKSNQKKHKKQK